VSRNRDYLFRLVAVFVLTFFPLLLLDLDLLDLDLLDLDLLLDLLLLLLLDLLLLLLLDLLDSCRAMFLFASGTKPIIIGWWPAYVVGTFLAQWLKGCAVASADGN
jgi:hypothetical protein